MHFPDEHLGYIIENVVFLGKLVYVNEATRHSNDGFCIVYYQVLFIVKFKMNKCFQLQVAIQESYSQPATESNQLFFSGRPFDLRSRYDPIYCYVF